VFGIENFVFVRRVCVVGWTWCCGQQQGLPLLKSFLGWRTPAYLLWEAMVAVARAARRLAVVVGVLVAVVAIVVVAVPIPGGEHDPHLRDTHLVQPPPGAYPINHLPVCFLLTAQSHSVGNPFCEDVVLAWSGMVW
jgi:hypothetical protein